jgi:hypothetical protein
LILTASKSSAVLCAFEGCIFYYFTCLCLLSCIRSYVLSVFTEVHTLISCGDTYIVSGMGGGLVIQQRGFFPSCEGLRLSWLGGYGSNMEWNGGGLIIEQRGFFPSREGLRLSWLRGYWSSQRGIYIITVAASLIQGR